MNVSSPTRALFVLLIATTGLLAVACADDAKNEPGDTADMTGGDDTTPPDDTTTPGDATGDTAPPPDVTEGRILVEPADALNEFRDCLAGCPHDGPMFTFDWRANAGLQGVIDAECHELAGIPFGADVDWVSLAATPRTLLEITVQPTEGSRMNPLIQTSSGNFVMTFNDDRAVGDVSARTVIAGPFVEELPFFVEIHHTDNYSALDPQAAACTGFVGGADYGYLLTVRELAFEPVELGDLTPGTSATGSGTIANPGDITYFRFNAPATSTPTVTLTRTGNSDFLLHAAGMNTIQGQMAWSAPKSDEAGAGTLTLTSSDFDVCRTDCDGASGEFVFAVTDWNGWGGGDYTFDVQVQL